MNSVVKEWNDRMNITDYLSMTWKYLMEGKRIPSYVILLIICNAHLLRRISKTIEKDMGELIGIKTLLLNCSALMIISRSMKELNEVFEEVLNVIYQKDEKQTEIPLKLLSCVKNKNAEDIDTMLTNSETYCEIEEEFIDLHKRSNSVYEKSQFYEYFRKKRTFMKDSLNINPMGEMTNKYYAVLHDAIGREIYDFGAYFLKTFLSFAPITTSILLDLVDNKVSRVSNAYSEAHNNKL